MRTIIGCPAGGVKSPPLYPCGGAAWAGACGGSFGGLSGGLLGAGGGGGSGARRPPPRVNVNATMSCVGNVCTSPFTSKRKIACVPPRYLPCSTRPSFSSSVSANPIGAKRNAATAAISAFETFRVVIFPSHFPRNALIDSPEVQRESQCTLTLMHWMSRSPYQVARATLLYRFVQALADLRHQRRAIHLLCQPAHQNYQNKWPLRKYNRCIVMNFCNLPGFVGHRNPLRQPCGNTFIEFLPLQNRYHLVRTGSINRRTFRDCLQQNSQTTRSGGIVQSF